jgi:O-acetyl-ADP-ribose deacetylase (regulator of RNase III)
VIRVVRSDLTSLDVQAAMRSVGSDLEPCSAADHRIGIQAGAPLLERLRRFGELPVGGAVVTPAGELGSELLIHVVIRSQEEPISEERVAKAFRNGLRQAAEWGVGTLAVPPLGVGAGNLDAEVSARVMCSVLEAHRAGSESPVDVVFLASNDYEEEAFAGEVRRVFKSG